MALVVYVVSDVRSGSTLLENVLSKSKSIVSVGELHHLDSHIHKGEWGKTWNWTCSCGESFECCDFWCKIYRRAGIIEAASIKKTQLIDGPANASKEVNNEIIKQLDDIYEAASYVSNSKVVIDSSKRPFQGVEIYKNSRHQVKLIHLKRDLRAVAISKRKWSSELYGQTLSLFKVMLGCYRYRAKCNGLIKAASEEDVYELSYEDLTRFPEKYLNEVCGFIGVEPIDMPEHMELLNDHTVGGTPKRFEKSRIKIDNKWMLEARSNPVFNAVGFVLNKLA